jgi:hypothetical protein
MATIPLRLPKYEEASPKQPKNIITPAQHDNGDITHGDLEMTKQEEAELKELVHQVAASVTLLIKAQTPAAQPATGTKWFMASIATITILGAAGNFVGSSGMWVGKSQTDFQHQAEKVTKLEEKVEILSTWNEKLRNNMAAYGWLVDIDGSVSRIEQKQPRRR